MIKSNKEKSKEAAISIRGLDFIHLTHFNWVKSDNIKSTDSARIPLSLFDHYPPRQRALHYIMTQRLNKKGAGHGRQLCSRNETNEN